MNSSPLLFLPLLAICVAAPGRASAADGELELIRDPHFQAGFFLLAPKPGKRVVYGKLGGLAAGPGPVWDLAQWSSRFPLQPGDRRPLPEGAAWTSRAKGITVGPPGGGAADLSLAVNASAEYPEARRSAAEPWVHLLVQQAFGTPPSLGALEALRFRLEARLLRSTLANTNGYSPSLHAAQYLVYLTVANRNPQAPGYHECFWFGIPVYDDRSRVVPAYEAQDFGGTSLFIFTPASDNFTSGSVQDRQWTVFEKDLLPLMRLGLEHARAKGFIKGSQNLADYRPLGIFIGWEVPGVFDVDLRIRNLSLLAVAKRQLLPGTASSE